MNYNDLIGIPFDEKSINGINCYELLRKAYKKHGIYIPKTNIAVCACKQISNDEIQDNILQYWEQIDEPEILCGIVIQSSNLNFANHIGTYVAKNKMLHIIMDTKSIIERIHPRYTKKIIGFYRFIGEK